jgi:hypothetical protein
MSDLELYVLLDEEIVPLSTCHWVRFDPVGCAESSMIGEMAPTAELAWKEFVPTRDDRHSQIRLGYSVRLVRDDRWSIDVMPCLRAPRQCDHQPVASIKTCYLCARIGTIGFAEIEPVPGGGRVTVCRQAAACQKRRGPQRDRD